MSSMNSDPDDFEALRKLMTLKRHEQPPPGYFSRLPDKIAARLEREGGQPGFWEKILAGLTFRPAFAYSFALAAFGALTFSVIFSVRTQPQESAQTPPGSGWRAGAPDEALASQVDSLQPLHVANWMGSTNPSGAALALPSLFDSSARRRTVPVSYASP
jgi:hypothetical protein